jgi:UPF0716 protein FxsA
MVKWFLRGLIALPIAEIGVFILVVATIGFVWALGIMLATTIAGLIVLRSAGRGSLALFRRVAADPGISGIEARIEANPHGFLVILAGILLVLPGFITDAIGILLLLAPVRQWCGQVFPHAAAHGEGGHDAVIDLEASDWHRVPDRKLENKHGKFDDV